MYPVIGAPPVSLVGTALHATDAVVSVRVAPKLVTSAGATATPRHPAHFADPLSSVLLTVTSTAAGVVRCTLMGTVIVVPSEETVAAPVVVTPASVGNDSAAPEWKLVPVTVSVSANVVVTYCGEVLLIVGPASVARSLLAVPKSGFVTVTVTVDGAVGETVTGIEILLPLIVGLSVAVTPSPNETFPRS